jgi:hypothetical protein
MKPTDKIQELELIPFIHDKEVVGEIKVSKP